MGRIESGKGFVNRWECDENDHMNVQFYWTKFQAAALHFRLQTGLEELPEDARTSRHIRYHSEVGAATPLAVQSFVTLDISYPFAIIHEMRDAISNRLSATLIDRYDLSDMEHWAGLAYPYRAPLTTEAAPRSFSPVPVSRDDAEQTRHSPKAVTSYRGQVSPDQCDQNGRALDSYIIHCATDGASHAWEAAGLTTDWLNENNLGRVAVEMKLSRLAPLQAHDPVHLVSVTTSAANRTFSFRHHLINTRSGALSAVVDVTGLAMDLGARKAVIWPKEIRARLDEAIG
ncbi:acyl-CoA thioesterase [Coralliovum pocilloporae]|uniref:acyl-CoA thioesterase n=1 Tax=Coralliovum pocilloporae TaxID=3066369 RepID=UPI0033072958